jgi:hypothetical protein
MGIPLWLLISLASVNSLATCVIGALIGVSDWHAVNATTKLVILLTIVGNWTGQLLLILSTQNRTQLIDLLKTQYEKALPQAPVNPAPGGNPPDNGLLKH